MRSYLKHFVVALALLFSLYGKAQELIIAKDYNSCLYGLIDRYGHWVLPGKYTQILGFQLGFSVVMLNNQYGLINTTGKEVVPLQYDNLVAMSDPGVFYYPDDTRTGLRGGSNSTQALFMYQASKNGLNGIIDTAGKIILPVRYQQLSNFRNGVGIFVSADGKKSGFFDLHGERGTLPDEFRYVMNGSRYPGMGVYIATHFSPTKKERPKFGLINDSAHLVLPCEYDSINACAGYANLVEVYKNGKTGYFDKSGKKVFDVIYTIKEARAQKIPWLALMGTVPAFDGTYWGVLKRDGSFALDFKYEELKVFPNYFENDSDAASWKVREKDKWGLITANGKWVLPASWSAIDERFLIMRVKKKNQYIFNVKSSGSWGAVSSSGLEIMPFVYDTVLYVDNNFVFCTEQEADLLAWRRNNPPVLIYNFDPQKEQEQLAKAQKKEQRRNRHKNVSDETDEAPDQRYERDGVYEGEGEGEERFYESYYFENPDPGDLHYAYGKYVGGANGLLVTHLRMRATSLRGYAFYTSPFPQEQQRRDELYDTYAYEGLQTPLLLANKAPHGFENCSLNALVYDSAFIYYSFGQSGLIRSDGKVILAPGIFRDLQVEGKYKKCLKAYTEHNHAGLLNLQGKFIIDSTWKNIFLVANDTAWVQSERNDQCKGSWNRMCISTGNLALAKENELLEPVTDESVSVAFTGTGGGLIDPKTLAFVLPPKYKSITYMGEYSGKFIVENCSGKIGVVNAQGKWETDSDFTSVIRLVHPYSGENKTKRPAHEEYLFLNAQSWILYDTYRGAKTGDAVMCRQVFQQACAQNSYEHTLSASEHSNRCSDCPLLDAQPLPDLRPWQSLLLFNSMYRSSSRDYRSVVDPEANDCACKAAPASTYGEGYHPSRVTHALHFQTDSVFVFEKGESYDAYNQDRIPDYLQWSRSYFNYVLYPEGPRKMTLDSLFTGEAWKVVIENETMNFLRTHPGIHADCGNPSLYPKILAEQFMLGTAGLEFYPHWGQEQNKDRIVFFIPWDKLEIYLRPEIASRLKLH